MNKDRLQKLLQMWAENEADTFAAYGIAMEYSGMGDSEEAIKWFKQVLRIDPNHIASHYQLGRLFFELGKADDAVAVLEQGLTLLSNSLDTKNRNEFRSLLDEILF